MTDGDPGDEDDALFAPLYRCAMCGDVVRRPRVVPLEMRDAHQFVWTDATWLDPSLRSCDEDLVVCGDVCVTKAHAFGRHNARGDRTYESFKAKMELQQNGAPPTWKDAEARSIVHARMARRVPT